MYELFQTTKFVGNLNTPRRAHGISLMKFNNQYKLVVFGGKNGHNIFGSEILDSVEVFDEETEQWENMDLKMTCPRKAFSFVTVFSNNKLIAGMNDESPVPTDGSQHSQQTWLLHYFFAFCVVCLSYCWANVLASQCGNN